MGANPKNWYKTKVEYLILLITNWFKDRYKDIHKVNDKYKDKEKNKNKDDNNKEYEYIYIYGYI